MRLKKIKVSFSVPNFLIKKQKINLSLLLLKVFYKWFFYEKICYFKRFITYSLLDSDLAVYFLIIIVVNDRWLSRLQNVSIQRFISTCDNILFDAISENFSYLNSTLQWVTFWFVVYVAPASKSALDHGVFRFSTTYYDESWVVCFRINLKWFYWTEIRNLVTVIAFLIWNNLAQRVNFIFANENYFSTRYKCSCFYGEHLQKFDIN